MKSTLLTKEDLANTKVDLIKWMVALLLGLFIALVGAMAAIIKLMINEFFKHTYQIINPHRRRQPRSEFTNPSTELVEVYILNPLFYQYFFLTIKPRFLHPRRPRPNDTYRNKIGRKI
jgi:hypothetical protein